MSGIFGGIVAAAVPPFSNFVNATVDHTTISPTNANAGISLQTDGTVSLNAGNTVAPTTLAWYTPTVAGIGSSYWARATIVSGSFSSGSGTGSWIAISGAPGWNRNRTTIGTTSVTFTLEIASDAGGANIVASATITLNAEKA